MPNPGLTRKQRVSDRSQSWMLAAASASNEAGTSSEPIFARRFVQPDSDHPEEVRWLTERSARAQAEQMYGIVTLLDSAMNNTSLILLF